MAAKISGEQPDRFYCWDKEFSELAAYKRRFGNCNLNLLRKANPQLGRWAAAQQTRYGNLSPDQLRRLVALGFGFPPLDRRWIERFLELVAFKQRHGHCNVPSTGKTLTPLGSWVNYQRVRRHRLSPNRLKLLHRLGFEWKPAQDAWGRMYRKLEEFRRDHGHCRVTRSWGALGKWVQHQRERSADGRLSAEHKRLLDQLCFPWRPLDAAWEEKLRQLKAYRKRFGHCRVPEEWQENPALAVWVSHQRQRRRVSKLSLERVRELNKLRFDWRVRKTK